MCESAYLSWLSRVVPEQLEEAIWANPLPVTPEQKLDVLDCLIAGLQLQRDILADEPEKMA